MKVLSVKVPNDVFSRIHEVAEKQQESVSELLRELFNDFLEEKEKSRKRIGIRTAIIDDLTDAERNFVVDEYINNLGRGRSGW